MTDRKCQSKNPAKCKIHGGGGQVEQLEVKANEAFTAGKHDEFIQIKKEIEDLSAMEAKNNFFGHIKARFKKTPESLNPSERDRHTLNRDSQALSENERIILAATLQQHSQNITRAGWFG